jgi:hypothetical protein
MMDKSLIEKSTVLTPKQLSERWQISLAKVYEDNNTGLLPRLSSNKNRFPVVAIEEMEQEPSFDKENISTPRERRYKRELEDQQRLLTQRDEEIAKLRTAIAKVQSFTTQLVFNIVAE